MFGAILFMGFCGFVVLLSVLSALPQSENPSLAEFIPFFIVVAITGWIGWFLFSTIF